MSKGGGTEDKDDGRGLITIMVREGLQSLWTAPVCGNTLLLPITELTMTDYDLMEVMGNLQKLRQSWARLLSIMGQEVKDARTLVHLYLSVVHAILVFFLETGVMTPHIGRVLGGFRNQV